VTQSDLTSIAEEDPLPSQVAEPDPCSSSSGALSSTEDCSGLTSSGALTLVVKKRVRVQGPVDPLYRIRDQIARPGTPTRSEFNNCMSSLEII
jgi:hypothetical protein